MQFEIYIKVMKRGYILKKATAKKTKQNKEQKKNNKKNRRNELPFAHPSSGLHGEVLVSSSVHLLHSPQCIWYPLPTFSLLSPHPVQVNAMVMQKLATASNMKAIFPNMLADLKPSTTPIFDYLCIVDFMIFVDIFFTLMLDLSLQQGMWSIFVPGHDNLYKLRLLPTDKFVCYSRNQFQEEQSVNVINITPRTPAL